MKAPDVFLDGSEFVLVALVPSAGDRWHQVHLNVEVLRRFFRLDPDSAMQAIFERVTRTGRYGGSETRPVVFSSTNKNIKIEFDFADAPDYPEFEPPILLILEIGMRRFRFMLLMPGDPGFGEMRSLNESLQKVGRGHRRVITTLSETEMRWPACPIRSPAPSV